MTTRRKTVAALIAALALGLAGCGGDDDDDALQETLESAATQVDETIKSAGTEAEDALGRAFKVQPAGLEAACRDGRRPRPGRRGRLGGARRHRPSAYPAEDSDKALEDARRPPRGGARRSPRTSSTTSRGLRRRMPSARSTR